MQLSLGRVHQVLQDAPKADSVMLPLPGALQTWLQRAVGHSWVRRTLCHCIRCGFFLLEETPTSHSTPVKGAMRTFLQVTGLRNPTSSCLKASLHATPSVGKGTLLGTWPPQGDSAPQCVTSRVAVMGRRLGSQPQLLNASGQK